jgi:hypothetical protein
MTLSGKHSYATLENNTNVSSTDIKSSIEVIGVNLCRCVIGNKAATPVFCHQLLGFKKTWKCTGCSNSTPNDHVWRCEIVQAPWRLKSPG